MRSSRVMKPPAMKSFLVVLSIAMLVAVYEFGPSLFGVGADEAMGLVGYVFLHVLVWSAVAVIVFLAYSGYIWLMSTLARLMRRRSGREK